MNLYVQQVGSGPDVVLLHGWGLHGGVFTALAEQLAPRFRLWLIDMPGHGRSPPPNHTFNLATLAGTVAAAAPPRAVWLGWSLGGMVATQLALTAPTRVESLILVASTPRFIAAADWPWAMDPAVLAGFARALQEDYHGTLERFISLQIASGSAEGRSNLRLLREMLLQFPAPAAQALRDGLAILRSADLRADLPALRCPALMILGDRDRLVPPGVGPAVETLLPSVQIEMIAGAGHVPFLSHRHAFLTAVTAFLEDRHDR
jgi:pimeloyl-[acyl-carrier protein] methyl ester esterase